MHISQIGFIFPKDRDENKKSLSCHHLGKYNPVPWMVWDGNLRGPHPQLKDNDMHGELMTP